MTVFRNEGRWDTSNVEFRDGRILRYDKTTRTPAMRHIDYGLGVLSAEALRRRPRDGAIRPGGGVSGDARGADELAGYEVHRALLRDRLARGARRDSRRISAGRTDR